MGEAKRKASSGVRVTHCRTCTLCCTLFDIHALAKPMYRPCRHIADGGCGIFASPERPETCAAYRCGWLTAQLTGAPDRRTIPHPLEIGAYYHTDPITKTLVLFVDPDRPERWKTSALAPILRRGVAAGTPLVVFDRGRRMTIATAFHFDEILKRDYVAFADAQGMPKDIPSYEAERAAPERVGSQP